MQSRKLDTMDNDDQQHAATSNVRIARNCKVVEVDRPCNVNRHYLPHHGQNQIEGGRCTTSNDHLVSTSPETLDHNDAWHRARSSASFLQILGRLETQQSATQIACWPRNQRALALATRLQLAYGAFHE